jgi:FkbM family methyltransferase
VYKPVEKGIMSHRVVDTCQISGLDAILYGVFGEKYVSGYGQFVEVGAHDGMTWSNTYHLARRGWSGLYVEPVTSLAERCVGNHVIHPNVKVVNVACGTADQDSIRFYTDNNDLYTSNEWLIEALSDKYVEYEDVCVETLDNLLRKHKIQTHFELLIIDVEGSEEDVLRGFNVDWHLPKMIIIEAHERHKRASLRRNAKFINEYMALSGYIRIYCDMLNNIYVLP